MVFWVIVAAITALSMFVLFLSGTGRQTALRTATASDKALYRARLSEIDQDVKLGRMDIDAAEAVKAEEARKLLRSQRLDQDANDAAKPWFASRYLHAAAVLFIPVFSIVLYEALGAPDFDGQVQQAQTEERTPSIGEMIAIVEERLRNEPDDLEGWKVISRVYVNSGQYENAVNAFSNIARIEGRSLGTLLQLGQAMVARDEGLVSQEAINIFVEAGALDIDNPMVDYHRGLFALQNDNQNEARKIWSQMISRADGNEAWLPAVRQHMAELDGASPSIETINDQQQAMIREMVDGLAARLEEAPQNREGWKRLVRAYLVLGETDRAERAADTARQTFADDAQFVDDINAIQSELGEGKQ